MATEKTDVVIVGLGAAGGVIAAELAQAGMKVIGLERGPRLSTKDFASPDEVRFFQRQDLRPDVKRQPVTWRPNGNRRGTPMRNLSYGNGAGGGTIHYGAVSWRFHEDDFRARSHTIERYGAAAVPADSSLADWPMTYAELEPFYDKAEYDLGISGKAGNLQGRKIAGGNMFEAPRAREYPLPPLTDDQSGILFDEAANKLGLHPFAAPHAIISQPYKGRPGCSYCGFCQAFGCHIGAKSSILVTKLPQADATGNFKLITGGMCYRIDSDNSGRVTGVSYYGPGGSDDRIEADIVILSTFIYDNTRLLLLSKTAKFPDGLANSSGQVGKHIMAHIGAKVFVAFDDRYVNNFMGPNAQKHALDDFNADNYDHANMGFIRGSQVAVATASTEGGPIAAATGMETPHGVPRWGAAYRDFFAKYYARHVVVMSETENLPYPDHMIDLDPDMRDAWGLPAPRVTYDWRRPNEQKAVAFIHDKLEEIARAMGAAHVWRAPLGGGGPGPHTQGGTRMGTDPKMSVVNKYSQSWDSPNLFIVGSSTNPSMSGFNPTLTIEAVAYMCADAIASRYRKSPGPLI
ncbi:MAG TPA: GMC family oxidoreductase [Xanthobacteraceae bacterium]|jgi:gluconate 2-dehydrogenase alpha chain